MKRVYLLFFTLALMGIQPVLQAQVVAPADLVGRWTLTKIEIVTMQGNAELSRQSYTPSDYAGQIYFEKIACSYNGEVVYSGQGDKTLLSAVGRFHTRHKGAIVFQNSLIGFTFGFSWEEKPDLFVLEKQGAVHQQNKQSERIRFFYQKEK